jgi:thioredoxin 1
MDTPGQVIDVDNGNFESEIIASTLPVLVDFWGPMCGPCKALEPLLVQLAKQHSQTLKVAKVNVDANTKTAVQYSIKALPTLLLFQNRKAVDQLTGRVTLRSLEKFIQRVL